MALLHWRKFIFFDEEIITDTELNQLVSLDEPKGVDLNKTQQIVTVKISCSSSGRGVVLLGDTTGYVYIINKYMGVNSFRANQKYTSHVKQLARSPIFVTCGSDQDGTNPLIKLWDPDKTDRLNQPTCLRLIRANSGFMKPSAVSCIELNETFTSMIIGYEDGSIVLFQGDITRQRRSKSSRPMKISERPITGIVIHQEVKINQNPSYLNQVATNEISAYIATDQEVLYVTLSDKSFTKNSLDQSGCQPRCCCFLPGPEGKTVSENLFAVGRDNAVYFYQTDGRGPCLAFEGEKLLLHRFKSYLVIVSREAPTKLDTGFLRSRRNQQDDKGFDTGNALKRVSVNIYDIRNKYIAHSTTTPEVQEIFSEWGQLFVVCTNGKLLVFKEKDTQTKLDTLFRKNQFSLVIDIAKAHQYDEDALTDIFKHYGDHLYRKGDFDGAIMQYIKTIGRSEPSYVIKKYLDSKRISSLTIYLEELHKKSFVSQEHTKLLLNCYSKLRSDQQLKQFIESHEDGIIKIDVDIAIKVLRDAGFYEFALYLAKKHQKHSWYFRVQMEDIGNSEAALEYLYEMNDTNDMAIYMKEYGRKMLKDVPERTISMIKTICERCREKRESLQESNGLNLINVTRQILPDEFFHIFLDNNIQFVLLLEQLIYDSTEFATKAVHNLLLELYLNSWRKESDDLMRSTLSEKIKKLLAQPGDRFDLDQALILCRNNRFDEGLIDLYTRAKLYHLIVQYYIDQEDSLKIMKVCEQFGAEDPNIYMSALIFYSKTGDERLGQLLKAIEHHQTIPPTMVIKILLESNRANLGSVREYLMRFLDKLYDKQVDNENAIDHYKDDTEVVKHKIEEFENHQTVFKPSKCSACQSILDLPTIHFLCNHSYHQNCFHNYSAESDECPICVSTNNKLLDEIEAHEISRLTLKKLERQYSSPNDDIFISLARLFGYNLVSTV